LRRRGAVIDARSQPRFHDDMGWTVRPLGLPEQIGPDRVLAVVMPIDAATLEATRAFYRIDEPVLMHAGLRPTITREIVL
jgi:N-acyl-L-homoserine lactone synthetase